MLLKLEGVESYYGTSHILFGVSLEVQKGEVVCLLGRNGAGKTTTFKSIIGIVHPKEGSIKFKDEEITGKPPYTIARKGIGYVPDYRGIFPDLTVYENLIVGQKNAKAEGWNIDKIYSLFPDLKRLQKHPGGKLSGGQQQMLTIARTLMGNPELLILDEPVEGLAPVIVNILGETFQALKKETKLAILLSEQNLKFAMNISDKAYIIEKGKIRYQGPIHDLEKNEEIKNKYLAI